MRTVLECYVRVLGFGSWESSKDYTYRRGMVKCSSGLDFLKPQVMEWSHQNWTWFKPFSPQKMVQYQQTRDEEIQIILVELSEEKVVNCPWGTSEKRGFTELTPILTEVKCIHVFLVQNPRENCRILKEEFNSVFSLTEEKYKGASSDNWHILQNLFQFLNID